MTVEAEPARLSGWSALGRVLGDRRYAAYMAGSSMAMAGQWMQRIALGWLMWEQTRSGVWLGALAIAELAPGLVMGPLGGVLTDRIDRRRFVMWCQGVLALQAVALGACIALDWIAPALLVTMAMVGGSAGALQEAGRSLLVRDVTPADCLATGVSLNAIAVNVTRFLGPALAAPLMALWGAQVVCLVNAATSLLFLGAIWTIQVQAAEKAAGLRASFAADLWRGVAAAATHATIAPVLLVFLASALLIRPLYELTPALAEGLLRGGVAEYSGLIMAIGTGATMGAALLAFAAPRRPAEAFMWSSLGACVCVMALGAAASFDLAILAVAALGFCMCIGATSSQLVVVMDAPDAVSGRVLSLWGAIIRAGPAFGAIAVGAAFDFIGYRWPLWIGALVCAAIIAATMLAAKMRNSRSRNGALNENDDFAAMPGAIVHRGEDL